LYVICPDISEVTMIYELSHKDILHGVHVVIWILINKYFDKKIAFFKIISYPMKFYNIQSMASVGLRIHNIS